MFSSNQYIKDVNEVPSKWVFENYLGYIKEPLDGRRIKIRSIFNPDERTPSMFLYYSKKHNAYRYKCFSTGNGGSATDLMMHTWNLDFKEASEKIIKDYVNFLQTGEQPVKEDFEVFEWHVTKHEIRKWTNIDASFWTKFNIGSELLEKHNVFPLKSYKMSKIIDDRIVDSFEITGNNIYGYFNKKGELCKIYQPYNKLRKFIKITDYMQGEDQLENNKYLVIASSLKDIMSIKSLGLSVDAIAPHSENTLIDKTLIKKYKKKYQAVVAVLDSDDAGIKAMKEYNEKYNITFCYLPLEKDVSDIMLHHGKDKTMFELVPKLNSAIEKYIQKND